MASTPLKKTLDVRVMEPQSVSIELPPWWWMLSLQGTVKLSPFLWRENYSFLDGRDSIHQALDTKT